MSIKRVWGQDETGIYAYLRPLTTEGAAATVLHLSRDDRGFLWAGPDAPAWVASIDDYRNASVGDALRSLFMACPRDLWEVRVEVPEPNRGYQGWSNRESWGVNLWFNNDQGTQEYWTERARECLREAFVQERMDADRAGRAFNEEHARTGAANNLADAMHEELRDGAGDLLERADAECSVYADLLGDALRRVDWREVAEGFLEDLPDPEEPTDGTCGTFWGDLKQALGLSDEDLREARRLLTECTLADWLEEVDALGSCTSFGVESIQLEGEVLLVYLNMGDTYEPTLCYDPEWERVFVGAWGDWLEAYEAEEEEDGAGDD